MQVKSYSRVEICTTELAINVTEKLKQDKSVPKFLLSIFVDKVQTKFWQITSKGLIVAQRSTRQARHFSGYQNLLPLYLNGTPV